MAHERFVVTPELTVIRHRCWECGRFYYVEVMGPNSSCPYCAHREIGEANRRFVKANRSAAALRGALTKARKR